MDTRNIALYVGCFAGAITLTVIAILCVGGAAMVATEVISRPQDINPLAGAMGTAFVFFAYKCGGLARRLAHHGLKAALAID